MGLVREIAFLHQNYPGQFGPIHGFLQAHYDCRVSFFSEHRAQPPLPGVRHVAYQPEPEASPPYFFSRYFEQECRTMQACAAAVQKHYGDTPPDCFVGHVGFGTLTFLHVLYPETPTVGFFEIFYNPFDAATYTRPGFPVPEANILRIPLRNATQLIELEYCTQGYCPTPFQRSTFPTAYQPKLQTLFDGVDTAFYAPGPVAADSPLQRTWPPDAKLVTFVSRGLEAFRGFDIFMDAARRICAARDDVHFVIAGNPKTHYGSEGLLLQGQTFKDYVLSQGEYDLSRFHFLDWISEPALRDLFRLSDCHFYWTIPFTLSWSFFQAMATGALIVASDSAPVRDVLRQGENGWLVPAYEPAVFAEAILKVLSAPQAMRSLREAARETILSHYSFDICLPKLADFYLQSIKG